MLAKFNYYISGVKADLLSVGFFLFFLEWYWWEESSKKLNIKDFVSSFQVFLVLSWGIGMLLHLWIAAAVSSKLIHMTAGHFSFAAHPISPSSFFQSVFSWEADFLPREQL